jgi:hypothetical protein
MRRFWVPCISQIFAECECGGFDFRRFRGFSWRVNGEVLGSADFVDFRGG